MGEEWFHDLRSNSTFTKIFRVKQKGKEPKFLGLISLGFVSCCIHVYQISCSKDKFFTISHKRSYEIKITWNKKYVYHVNQSSFCKDKPVRILGELSRAMNLMRKVTSVMWIEFLAQTTNLYILTLKNKWNTLGSDRFGSWKSVCK